MELDNDSESKSFDDQNMLFGHTKFTSEGHFEIVDGVAIGSNQSFMQIHTIYIQSTRTVFKLRTT
jgi:hypothetical protein